MTPVEQKKAAKAFVDRWKAAEGNEQREANSFWIELCSQVLGIANPTQRLDFERKVISFFMRKENSRMEREKDLSVKAGEVVGKLYDAFSKAYIDIENDKDEQRSLNVLITRIVFLLYAEDADLLHQRNSFYLYLRNFQVEHMRQALIDLFAVLKTPEAERSPYLSPELSAFPYMNGELFAADITIPQFTQDTRFILLQEASADFDWSGISPTIFGAVFESTLSPETRRSGGMRYTSVANIHRLTGPLFYDALENRPRRSRRGSRSSLRRRLQRRRRENCCSPVQALCREDTIAMRGFND